MIIIIMIMKKLHNLFLRIVAWQNLLEFVNYFCTAEHQGKAFVKFSNYRKLQDQT